MKLLNISIVDSVRTYKFDYRGKAETVWFRSNQSLDTSTNNVTSFVLFGAIFAMLDDGILNLNGGTFPKLVLENIQKVAKQYQNWFPELKLKNLKLHNYECSESYTTGNGEKMLAFTGGIDSLYALHKLIQSEEKLTLLHIEGFDNHYQDTEIYQKIHSDVAQLEKAYNLPGTVSISTNIRDFTEQYIDWNNIHGLCMAGCIYSLQSPPETIFVSVNWTQAIDYNCGCQDNLNPLFSSENVTFKDTGLETRLTKVEALSKNPLLLPYVRVCWKNPPHSINCGVCEKCIRTMLAFMVFLPERYVYKLFKVNEIRIGDIEQINISNSETYWFYKDICDHLPENLELYKNPLKKKIDGYTPPVIDTKSKYIWKPQKKKAILFIDFNGVISYKPFWFSLAEKSHKLHDIHQPIENFLFKENVHIIKKWMSGEFSSEEVHDQIHVGLNKNFDKEELWKTFVEDCKNIDISLSIISELAKMKDKYHVILITDNMDSFDRFTLKAQEKLFTIFDEVSNSYNEKMGKKDNKCSSFFKYIDRYKANRKHCLLLDDSGGNCQAFDKYVGGRSYQVKKEEEVLDVLSELQKEQSYRWEWQY